VDGKSGKINVILKNVHPSSSSSGVYLASTHSYFLAENTDLFSLDLITNKTNRISSPQFSIICASYNTGATYAITLRNNVEHFFYEIDTETGLYHEMAPSYKIEVNAAYSLETCVVDDVSNRLIWMGCDRGLQCDYAYFATDILPTKNGNTSILVPSTGMYKLWFFTLDDKLYAASQQSGSGLVITEISLVKSERYLILNIVPKGSKIPVALPSSHHIFTTTFNRARNVVAFWFRSWEDGVLDILSEISLVNGEVPFSISLCCLPTYQILEYSFIWVPSF